MFCRRVSALCPMLIEMQVEAIVRAAMAISDEKLVVYPEISMSNICSVHEMDAMLALVRGAIDKVELTAVCRG